MDESMAGVRLRPAAPIRIRFVAGEGVEGAMEGRVDRGRLMPD